MKISKKATTIAIVNQKGGTGKTTTCENLGVGLASASLLVDNGNRGCFFGNFYHPRFAKSWLV